MTPEELHNWLLDVGIQSDLRHVSQLTAVSEIDNLETSLESVGLGTDIDWNRLILAGSILARSEQRRHQEGALRIATGALTIGKDVATRDAAAILLGKLANHRAVEIRRNSQLHTT